MTSQFTLKEKNKIILDIADIRSHINILNTETGELRDVVKEIKVELKRNVERNAESIEKLTISTSKTQVNVEWLMKSYWVVATAAGGAFVTSLFNIVERLR